MIDFRLNKFKKIIIIIFINFKIAFASIIIIIVDNFIFIFLFTTYIQLFKNINKNIKKINAVYITI